MSGQRATLRRGLPYGWRKGGDFWAVLLVGVPALVVLLGIIAAWFFDLK